VGITASKRLGHLTPHLSHLDEISRHLLTSSPEVGHPKFRGGTRPNLSHKHNEGGRGHSEFVYHLLRFAPWQSRPGAAR
jgi:hypothetical protein